MRLNSKSLFTVSLLLFAVACAPAPSSDSLKKRQILGATEPPVGEDTPTPQLTTKEIEHSTEPVDEVYPAPSEASNGNYSHIAPPLRTSPEVFIQGQRSYQFEAFKLPQVIIDRKSRRGEKVPSSGNLYEMHSSHLVIDLSKDKMILEVDLEAEGRREEIRLEGTFDRQGRNWLSNLYATDPVVRGERRVQAVVFCLRPFICDQIWMDLYYLVQGELKRRQFVVGAEKPQISLSESLSIPLPDVDSKGHLLIPPAPVLEEDEDHEDEASERVAPPSQPPVAPVEVQPESSGNEEAAPAPAENTPEENFDGTTVEQPRSQPENVQEAPEDEQPVMPEAQAPVMQIPPLPRPRPKNHEPQKVHVDEVTVEYSTELQLPPPEIGQYSVQGAENLQIRLSGRWSPQAMGSHTNGYLENGTLMEHRGCGIKRRDTPGRAIERASQDTTASWGTDLMMEMLNEAACAVERKKSGHPLLVGNISIRRGGKYGSHSSHQTGLDADLGFYHKKKDITAYWRPLDGDFEANFDYERNWNFLKALHSTAEERLMIVFVDQGIKNKLCRWVERTEGLPRDENSPAYKALRHLRHWAGHANHYHVRLYCPGTSGCQNRDADPNFSGTGC